MSANATAAHEAPTQQPLPGLADHAPDSRDSNTHTRHQPRPPAHPPTDDEILGLDTASPRSPDPTQSTFDFDAISDVSVGRHSERSVPSSSLREAPGHQEGLPGQRLVEPGRSVEEPLFDAADSTEPASFRGIFEANPELRQAWQDANAYRETFATPEAARAATAQLADLNHMDALFFSRRPEDHAELARAVATLDPERLRRASASHHRHGRFVFRRGTASCARHQSWRDVAHSPAPTGRHSERIVPSSSLREGPGHAVKNLS